MVLEATGPASGLDQDRVDFRRTFVDEAKKIQVFFGVFFWYCEYFQEFRVRKYLIPLPRCLKGGLLSRGLQEMVCRSVEPTSSLAWINVLVHYV